MSDLVENPEDRLSHIAVPMFCNIPHGTRHPKKYLPCHMSSQSSEYMSRDTRKPVFGVSVQVRRKPACTVTEKNKNLEILGISKGGIVLSE